MRAAKCLSVIKWSLLCGPLLLAAAGCGTRQAAPVAPAAPKTSKLEAPVKHVADQALAVKGAAGEGALPLYASADIHAPAPTISTVMIVIHGTLRNADTYFGTGKEIVAGAGRSAGGVMVVAPQFLTAPDVEKFSMPAQTLRWSQEGWKSGEPAIGPAPLSSFEAIDALLDHFADKKRYPALKRVVVMGHSAGAQILQRYAAVGQGGAALARRGIPLRYVVANPSSYVYFSDDRPALPAGGACPAATRWKYQLEGGPPYVASQDSAAVESRYAARNVVYLLGQADTDPYTHFIDRSCGGMAQGPNRLERGRAYFDYLTRRHPAGLNQKVVEVPGVGHDNLGMFTSACGIAVLFDRPLPASCPVVGR
ncbi:alpha/beta hydrolase [Achromobacter insuavis]